MFLRELEVENLRALRSARLELESTTALIGENGCGATSLLDAIELALGDGEEARALHPRSGAREPAEPLRIVLAFEERRPGEWAGAEHAVLDRALPARGRTRRRVVLEATAEAPRARATDTTLVRTVHGVADPKRAAELVEHLRRMNPVVRVSGSSISGHGAEPGRRSSRRLDLSGLEPAVAALVECILKAAEDLLGRRSARPQARLEEGFQASRELLQRRPQHIDAGAGGLARSVLEILGEGAAAAAATHAAEDQDSGTVAERLGVLLLIAAVLRRIPAGLPPGCEPIWIVEEPEAHLHPMTLASVARLLERVRWQKLVTTQSADFLARLPLGQVRRLVRHEGRLYAHGVRPRALTADDLRRVGHHMRARRAIAMFARVWLLVEGESEFWILPQIAQVLGCDLDRAGIVCLEYAQCGVEPLVRTARELGIEWHLLADGDEAGRSYAEAAFRHVKRAERDEKVTVLRERDIEHCLWRHGYSDLLLEAAGISSRAGPEVTPRRAITIAVRKNSKPRLALALVEAIARRGPSGVPQQLARVVEACDALARGAAARIAASARARPRR